MDFVSDHHLHSLVEVDHILDLQEEVHHEAGLNLSLLLEVLNVLEVLRDESLVGQEDVL